MTVAMVMAMDRNGLIGADGGMPWHLPSEMAYFKRVTMGKPMIMGRLTFESIGKPLPGRTSIVVTRSCDWSSPAGNAAGQDWQAAGVLQASSVEEALLQARKLEGVGLDGEIAVIGGATICREAMPLTNKLYLTVINHEFSGDTWLDSYQPEQWTVASEEKKTVDGFELSYLVLERAVAG